MADATVPDTDVDHLVSIVIPTCDRAAILARCLEALIHQTHASCEIIVVDDCSSDGTADVLSEFGQAHPAVAFRWFRNPTHAGANASRNLGIRQARGSLVAFLDADCIAREDWLERLVAGFESEEVAAVTGMVEDAPAENIFDLTFKGTHRVHGRGEATRLVAGNMCVRRELLLRYRLEENRSQQPKTADGRPDVSVSGRGDEEGLYLKLRAAGYRVRVTPDAVVLHEHHLNGRSFLRQAFRGGASAARLVWIYRLRQRMDMLPFMLAYATLPLGFAGAWLFLVPGLFMLAALAAITYNDLFRKRKTVGETILTFPLLVLYYHFRLAGYVWESTRLRMTSHNLQRVDLRRLIRD
jgi:glycosyltransferase involved in cell wall biosynthesis